MEELKGDCFRWALKDAAMSGGVLVHGWVLNPFFLEKGVEDYMVHGWVERDGMVYDWQRCDQKMCEGGPVDIEEFYETYKPQHLAKYHEKVFKKAIDEGHYGPWHPEPWADLDWKGWRHNPQGHHPDNRCLTCGGYRRHNPRGHHPSNHCLTCGISGEEHLFRNSDQCMRCYNRERSYHSDNKCATPGCPAEGEEIAFHSKNQCMRCYMRCYARERSQAVTGRLCKSCGWTDEEYAEVGRRYGPAKTLCSRCAMRKAQYKKRGWPAMCVSDQHILPPPRTGFTVVHGIQPRDFPACACYVNDEGVVIPDPEIRRIPLEDEADPSRGYTPFEARFRLAEERFDPGESREISQIPGHGPSEEFDPTGRKGSSRRSPRRSTRGGSPFGPRRPNPRLKRVQRKKKPAALLGENLVLDAPEDDLQENIIIVGPFGQGMSFFGFHPGTHMIYFLIDSDDRDFVIDELGEGERGFPIFMLRRPHFGAIGTLDQFWKHKSPITKKLAAAGQFIELPDKIVFTHVAARRGWKRRKLGTTIFNELKSRYPDKPILFHDLTDQGRKFMEHHKGEEYTNG